MESRLNLIQKAVFWMFQKAVGFPVWTGSTTDLPPGGWRQFDPYGQYSQLLDVPVFRGIVRVLGNTIGSLPFNVFTEDSSGVRTKATDHPAYSILHDSPNAYMTSMELRQAMMLDWCQTGNGYCEVVKMGKRLASLNPLQAYRMHPQFIEGEFVYRYSSYAGKQIDYSPEQIIHIKNPTSNGYIGMPHVPPGLVQRAVDTHAYGGNFMRNQGRPSGILSSDQNRPANDVESDKLKAAWDAAFSGANAGKTAVLWKNLKYQAVSVSPEDAQYNETMMQLNAEFAGIFGVPLNLLDQTDKTATYASAEQFSIQFVRFVIGTLAEMFEQAFNKKLFLANEPNVFCELDIDGLSRGDSVAQATTFSSYTQNGIMTRNEVRRKLNLPEMPDGDELTAQINLAPLDELNKPAEPAPTTAPPVKDSGHITNVVTPLAKEQMGEMVAAVVAGINKKHKKLTIIRDKSGMVTGGEVVQQ
jgi:HK97 family phage portal protein